MVHPSGKIRLAPAFQKRQRNMVPVSMTTAVTTDSAETTRSGAVFQIALVVTHSLPWSMAAVELAAGVRKARQHATVTRMTGCSASMPLAVQ